jgi:flagellar assembly factor FliW
MSTQVVSETPQVVVQQKIQTRLGEIEFLAETVFNFENGLLGFEERHEYALAPLPNVPEENNYLVMHNLEKNEPTFIVKLVGTSGQIDESFVKKVDLKIALLSIGVDLEDTMVGLLVIIDDTLPKGQRVGYNLDGPLVFCLKTKRAWQVVINNR